MVCLCVCLLFGFVLGEIVLLFVVGEVVRLLFACLDWILDLLVLYFAVDCFAYTLNWVCLLVCLCCWLFD